jgi:LemA protein
MYGIGPRKPRRGLAWRLARKIRSLRMLWSTLLFRLQRYNVHLVLFSFVVALWLVTHIYYYNQLTFLEQSVEVAWAQVEVGEQKRNHVSRNLLALARYYAKYERDTMSDVTRLRVKPETPPPPSHAEPTPKGAGEAVADASLTKQGQLADVERASPQQLLGQLRMVAEQYPSLQLNNTVQQFSKTVVDSEGEIAERIMAYNMAVHVYMTRRTQFPVRLFASMLGFGVREFYAPDNRAVLDYRELKP